MVFNRRAGCERAVGGAEGKPTDLERALGCWPAAGGQAANLNRTWCCRWTRGLQTSLQVSDAAHRLLRAARLSSTNAAEPTPCALACL